MRKTRDLFKKIGDTKGIFYAIMGTIKHRNHKDLTEGEEERYIHLNAECQRIARRDKKAFLSDQ